MRPSTGLLTRALTRPSSGSLICLPSTMVTLLVRYDFLPACLDLNLGKPTLPGLRKKFLYALSRSRSDCWSAIESTSESHGASDLFHWGISVM